MGCLLGDRPALAGQFDRQIRIFGPDGQAVLQGLRVAVIGAGGVGSLLVEYLGRLGVGQLIVIDPEQVAPSNLPRMPGSRPSDIPLQEPWVPEVIRRWAQRRLAARKVKIVERLATESGCGSRVVPICGDILDPSVAAALIACDFVFLAADSMRARLLFNATAHQYLIPGMQVGSKVQFDKATGDLLSVFSVVRPIDLDGGCLWCNGLIPPRLLQEEAATPRERAQQRYVEDPTIEAPSVITLNAVGASYAANTFLFWATGLRVGEVVSDYVRVDARSGLVSYDAPRRDLECPECSLTQQSRRARGDSRDLPTRSLKMTGSEPGGGR